MKVNTIRAIRRDCVRVMGRDPVAEGATPEEAKRQLEEWLQREGRGKRYVAVLTFAPIIAAAKRPRS